MSIQSQHTWSTEHIFFKSQHLCLTLSPPQGCAEMGGHVLDRAILMTKLNRQPLNPVKCLRLSLSLLTEPINQCRAPQYSSSSITTSIIQCEWYWWMNHYEFKVNEQTQEHVMNEINTLFFQVNKIHSITRRANVQSTHIQKLGNYIIWCNL